MNIPLLNLKRQYTYLQKDIEQILSEILTGGAYINGLYVKKLEKELAEYLDVKHVMGVANGTDALVIALEALGVGKGDEVITSPFTFFATAEAISAVGATPVFVDVKLSDFNIDETKIEAAITDKTKVIMPVHIFGTPAEMDKIMEIAKKYNLYVIEDACQAIGAKYKDKMVGSIADISCFSFFPTKNLGTYGDGGLLTTNNDDLATVCRALKAHGSGEQGEKAFNYLNKIEAVVEESVNVDDTVYNPKKYYNYLIGHNSRLDELHAGILTVKLPYLDKWNDNRIKNAEYYDTKLDSKKYKKMQLDEKNKSVYHMYIIQTENRDNVVQELEKKNIGYGVYYPVPLHLQKVYKDLGYKLGSMPNAEYLSERTLAIPVDPELTEEERSYIVDILNNIGE
ncbi:DegT/DnrJ/EryC1/StrS family aminotransferase [Fusobacterium necrophorum]|uniref:DegT/DnrJ/EryC1/StrS family aminotransferase n=1 Tax=Fusobacterium necrophorum TaxID=859 RepID=UPI0008884A2A|nr:DegT/DnrJ/EryC1/StrS family aminotransferase [Fusobacterium necrophorum]AYZ73089.1 DegT/DnrJ/EryC1/StrS family aminotransferase [Fusobacterium necrophorum]AZW08914.1 DegT/DnrJ/EryC1/StrS family aminotransferase [Fusobacterium necrophorum subsp. necrophorum]SDB41726.1 dTDP-4-amino-4,6-dideoxygalactose transaminase [Fusobacterium necrophorum]SQD09885.1 UDP-4-amino-4-deoxy-L-arabinose--oxoglutarate aminotransferase [Fusobacterium necrophorum subsp. necrophorum]